MIKVSPFTRCVKSERVESYVDYAKGTEYTIYREEDKRVDPHTLEPYGRSTVWYAVCEFDDMIDSFKTLKEARKYIKNL